MSEDDTPAALVAHVRVLIANVSVAMTQMVRDTIRLTGERNLHWVDIDARLINDYFRRDVPRRNAQEPVIPRYPPGLRAWCSSARGQDDWVRDTIEHLTRLGYKAYRLRRGDLQTGWNPLPGVRGAHTNVHNSVEVLREDVARGERDEPGAESFCLRVQWDYMPTV